MRKTVLHSVYLAPSAVSIRRQKRSTNNVKAHRGSLIKTGTALVQSDVSNKGVQEEGGTTKCVQCDKPWPSEFKFCPMCNIALHPELAPSDKTTSSSASTFESVGTKMRVDTDGYVSVTPGVHRDQADKIPKRIGKYQIEETLGEGTFGIVLKGRDENDQIVAIKVLKRLETRYQNQAKAEFEMLQPLNHRHIIRCIESLTDKKGSFCTVIEFANHGDLRNLIKEQADKNPKWGKKEIAEYFKQIVSGMACMHNNNIMHRDLKPANIVICRSPSGILQMKITDFGLAKEVADTQASAGTVCGTRLYMSPEILNNTRYTMANDVWALGCILYEMSMFKRPFNDPLDVLRLLENRFGSIPKIRSSDGNKLTGLISICSQILVRDPKLRPRSRELLTKMLKLQMEIETEETKRVEASSSIFSIFNSVQVEYTNYEEFFHVVHENDIIFVKSLIEAAGKGIDVNFKRQDGQTATAIARAKGDTQMLHVLETCEQNIWQTLMTACSQDGDRANKVVEMLGTSPSDVNQRKFGADDADNIETALHYCGRFVCVNVARILVCFPNINVNKSSLFNEAMFQNGLTPLHTAASRGHHEIVEILLRHPKIDVNAQFGNFTLPHTNCRDTVLMMCVSSSIERTFILCKDTLQKGKRGHVDRLKSVQLLMSHQNIDVNLKDWDKQTAVDRARRQNRVVGDLENFQEIVDTILRK